MRDELQTMALYNRWMNQRLYDAAARLDDGALAADRGAYFGSVLGTLNHILVADLIWLHRFHEGLGRSAPLAEIEAHPRPSRLDLVLHERLDDLRRHRDCVDDLIVHWLDVIDEATLSRSLQYSSLAGAPFQRRLSLLLMHFFNHQTHHRAQAGTLLHQAGIDVGVTDFVAMLSERDRT